MSRATTPPELVDDRPKWEWEEHGSERTSPDKKDARGKKPKERAGERASGKKGGRSAARRNDKDAGEKSKARSTKKDASERTGRDEKDAKETKPKDRTGAPKSGSKEGQRSAASQKKKVRSVKIESHETVPRTRSQKSKKKEREELVDAVPSSLESQSYDEEASVEMSVEASLATSSSEDSNDKLLAWAEKGVEEDLVAAAAMEVEAEEEEESHGEFKSSRGCCKPTTKKRLCFLSGALLVLATGAVLGYGVAYEVKARAGDGGGASASDQQLAALPETTGGPDFTSDAKESTDAPTVAPIESSVGADAPSDASAEFSTVEGLPETTGASNSTSDATVVPAPEPARFPTNAPIVAPIEASVEAEAPSPTTAEFSTVVEGPVQVEVAAKEKEADTIPELLIELIDVAGDLLGGVVDKLQNMPKNAKVEDMKEAAIDGIQDATDALYAKRDEIAALAEATESALAATEPSADAVTEATAAPPATKPAIEAMPMSMPMSMPMEEVTEMISEDENTRRHLRHVFAPRREVQGLEPKGRAGLRGHGRR